MQRVIAVIPVRMASSRFPGKPLARLHGIPMVEHVFRRAELCPQLEQVCVATCDQEIRDVAEGFGARVILTSAEHERATDRVAEAIENLAAHIVVMIQGDEPMITPEMIQNSLEPFRSNPSTSCVNLVHHITTQRDLIDTNTIKVSADVNGNALCFSRSLIPHVSFGGPPAKIFKQVCVIAFTRQCLKEFSQLPPTPLECAESIDMLRLLEHGRSVHLVETSVATHSVDTPEDLELVQALMKDDVLMQQYLN